jgi:hypothetical protein
MSQENHTQGTSGIQGDDDPAERRRILNIQAQRRYRQRKRSRLRELESLAQLSVQKTTSGTECGQSSTSSDNQNFTNFYQAPELAGTTGYLNSNPQSDLLAETVIQELESFEAGAYPADDFSFPAGGGESLQDVPTSIDFESLMLEFDNQNSTFIPSISSNEPPADPGASSLSAPDQISRPNAAFADYLITIPGISCIRAHVEIFKVMHGPDFRLELWNPQALSPFALPGPNNVDQTASKPSHYPPEFHPTALQRTIQHHPVLDILPWPSFRDKFLYVMTLPDDFRPQIMRGTMASAMMQMMVTMKDAGGGLRVWGSNPFDIDAWEIGQLFYTNFWWAIDHDIVANSNELRLQRGENVLRASF